MARELPIHNGRMTTDLDANGFKIKNLPPGSGFTQAQADWNQTDATAPDFIKNKPTIPVVPTLATVATSGSYDDLTDKPTIPAAVTVDSTLAVQGAAADAKAVGDALRSGFTPWDFSGLPGAWTVAGDMEFSSEISRWMLPVVDYDGVVVSVPSEPSSMDAVEVQFQNSASYHKVTRSLVTPTKTSQLTNDGDGTNAFVKTNDSRLSDARTPTAHTHAIADVTGLNAALAQKASMSDLPYRLVEPGEWEFSGLSSLAGGESTIEWDTDNGMWIMSVTIAGPGLSQFYADGTVNDLTVDFDIDDYGMTTVTATRASLPGHLCDRANNLIDATTGNVTLTLPEYRAGKLRDLLVYVDLGDDGTDPYSVTFNFPSGESNTGFKAEGDDPTSATFPAPTAAGEWWYSFTECKPHKFAVSLKQLQDAPQAQGGS